MTKDQTIGTLLCLLAACLLAACTKNSKQGGEQEMADSPKSDSTSIYTTPATKPVEPPLPSPPGLKAGDVLQVASTPRTKEAGGAETGRYSYLVATGDTVGRYTGTPFMKDGEIWLEVMYKNQQLSVPLQSVVKYRSGHQTGLKDRTGILRAFERRLDLFLTEDKEYLSDKDCGKMWRGEYCKKCDTGHRTLLRETANLRFGDINADGREDLAATIENPPCGGSSNFHGSEVFLFVSDSIGYQFLRNNHDFIFEEPKKSKASKDVQYWQDPYVTGIEGSKLLVWFGGNVDPDPHYSNRYKAIVTYTYSDTMKKNGKLYFANQGQKVSRNERW